MKTVVIDRSKWRTGSNGKYSTGDGETKLLNENGFKCCLGFICGAYKKGIKGAVSPEDTNCPIPHLTKRRDGTKDYIDTDLAREAMRINDYPQSKPEIKELRLKKLFEGKFDLQFIGSYK